MAAVTAGSPPWRRSTADAPAGSPSVDQAEIAEEKENLFSLVTPDFVPRWRQARAADQPLEAPSTKGLPTTKSPWSRQPPQAVAGSKLNLDEYTDDDSSTDGNVTNVEPFAEPTPGEQAATPAGRLAPWKKVNVAPSTDENVSEKPWRQLLNGPKVGDKPWKLSAAKLETNDASKDEPLKEDKNAKEVEYLALSPSNRSECLSEPEGEETLASPQQEAVVAACEGVFNVADMLKWRFAGGAQRDASVRYTGLTDVEDSAAGSPAGRTRRRSSDVGGEASATTSDLGSWRRVATPPQQSLDVSDKSWVAQQRARRSSEDVETDAQVARSIKGILNKLTIEKFAQLYQQLLDCGICTAGHVEILIKEVFEKATTQHHFIDMYADLCAQLHEQFANSARTEDRNVNFKRLLLNECQSSFERNLKPPADLHLLEHEEKLEAGIKYKTRMLGNIRFVGALLVRKMLASKVFLAIIEELLGDPTAEALESIAALLTTAGPTFDKPGWVNRPALTAIFVQIEDMVQRKVCASRARFLLKDVLELRANGWQDRKASRVEAPTTLTEQAQKAAQGDGGAAKSADLLDIMQAALRR